MKVILLEKVRNLGNVGDVVSVKQGYSRNFLVPQKKAIPATPDNIKDFEGRREELMKREQQLFAAAQEKASKLNDITLTISALASDEGKLFGSVGIHEIREALASRSIEVDKKEIVLSEGAFHSVGNFVVQIFLHSDVVANVKIDIVPA